MLALSLPFTAGLGRGGPRARPLGGQRPRGAGPAGAAHLPHHRGLPRLHPRPRAAGEPAPAARGHLAAARQRRHPGGPGRLPRLGALGVPRRAWPSSCCSARPGARVPPSAAARRVATPIVMAPLDDPEDHHRLLRLATASGALTTRTGTGRGQHLDAYAAGRGLKDAMAAALRTDDRVHGLLLVGGRLGDVHDLHLERPRAARHLRPPRGDLARARPAGGEPPPGHRPQGAAAAPGAARPADRAAQPHPVPGPGPPRRRHRRRAPASGPPSSTWTSTASSRSTTRSATRPATCSCAPSPTGSAAACGRPTPLPASAVTSSSSCSTGRSTASASPASSTASAPSSTCRCSSARASSPPSAPASVSPSATSTSPDADTLVPQRRHRDVRRQALARQRLRRLRAGHGRHHGQPARTPPPSWPRPSATASCARSTSR